MQEGKETKRWQRNTYNPAFVLSESELCLFITNPRCRPPTYTGSFLDQTDGSIVGWRIFPAGIVHAGLGILPQLSICAHVIIKPCCCLRVLSSIDRHENILPFWVDHEVTITPLRCAVIGLLPYNEGTVRPAVLVPWRRWRWMANIT